MHYQAIRSKLGPSSCCAEKDGKAVLWLGSAAQKNTHQVTPECSGTQHADSKGPGDHCRSTEPVAWSISIILDGIPGVGLS